MVFGRTVGSNVGIGIGTTEGLNVVGAGKGTPDGTGVGICVVGDGVGKGVSLFVIVKISLVENTSPRLAPTVAT